MDVRFKDWRGGIAFSGQYSTPRESITWDEAINRLNDRKDGAGIYLDAVIGYVADYEYVVVDLVDSRIDDSIFGVAEVIFTKDSNSAYATDARRWRYMLTADGFQWVIMRRDGTQLNPNYMPEYEVARNWIQSNVKRG